MIYVKCINCSYNNVAKGIRLLDKLEDLTVLKRSPDLIKNVRIGRDQLRLIMKHILFYGGCLHFGQVT